MTRRPSIQRRLGTSFAALALVLFSATSVFEYLAFDQQLERATGQELQGAADTVLHLIEDMRTDQDPNLLRHRLDDVRLGHRAMNIWLAARNDAPIYGTAPMPIPLGTPFRIGSAGHARYDTQALRMPDGKVVNGIVHRLPDSSSALIAKLILTIDDDDPARLRKTLASSLAAALVLGTLSATVLGILLSRRALRPLREISDQANALSATAIDARLPEGDVDAEILALASSFNRALSRIETAFRQQEAFSADVAHELNTPLATLIAGNEIALATGVEVGDLREQLADNLDELHRLKGIVADMLFLSRVDQGERARDFPASSLSALVRDVVEYHDAALSEAHLSAVVEGDFYAEVDPPLVKRAVSNLVSNATRFATPGSKIQVSVTASAAHVQIAVTNQGDTVPEKQLPRLFDRFYRAETSRSSSDRHHGLGLAIVAAIARMHSGATFAKSSDGFTTIGFSVSRSRAAHAVAP